MGKLLGSFIFVVLTSLVALFIYEYVGEETTPPSRSKAEIFGPRSQAQVANKSQIDQAVQVVKDLCLAGKQYDLHVDAKGNIVIKKFIPGAEGSVTISEREATGHTPTYDEKLRIIADAQVRSCTKEHIPDILKATLSSQQSSSTPHGDIKKPPPTDGNLLSELREDQPGWAIKKESNYNLVNSQLSAQGLFTASAGDSSWDNYVGEYFLSNEIVIPFSFPGVQSDEEESWPPVRNVRTSISSSPARSAAPSAGSVEAVGISSRAPRHGGALCGRSRWPCFSTAMGSR